MPCDRVYTTSVNLEGADRALLVKALEALGWQPHVRGVVIDFRVPQGSRGSLSESGTLRYNAPQEAAEKIAIQLKQSYAAQCVASAAKEFGWVSTPKSAAQVVLTRRR